MGLKFKIFMGYVILIALLAFTIFLFRKEQVKRNTLKRNEKELVNFHRLSEYSYAGLLELATRAETVSVWNETDIRLYHDKRKETCGILYALKGHTRLPEQQARIDTLCLLLEKKEKLLEQIMNTFHQLQDFNTIVSQRIPSIVSRVRSMSDRAAEDPATSGPEESPEKKRGFWSFLKRRDKKSAYLEQKAKKEKEDREKQTVKAATGMLRSLDKDIMDRRKAEEERMLSQMEKLYRNSMALNLRLHDIMKDLRSETGLRGKERYEQLARESDRLFNTLSILAVLISVLTIILYVIIHRDLKRKYRYQKELEVSDRKNRELLQSKKDMMLAIAHDLRSPLTTITGSADLLPGEKDGRRKAKYVENIRHASEYMLSLVDTLMDFYLLDTGQAQSYERIFHLESLFKETVDNYAPLAQRKSLRLSFGFSGTDVVVCGDKGHLQQIVNNLLSNALKFTKEGSVRMEAEYRNGELRLCVRDTGSGMDEKDAERIFTAFERLENARGVSGFGLGLAICSRLVSRMGGSIRVESRKGQGSEFIVLLPLPPADGKSPLDTERVSRHLRMDGTRVLVLDDDLRQLGIVREMLRRLRAQCDCCGDSSELISKLRENGYDLLLMDIQMPEMDGFAVLELLRRSNIPQAKVIPVIALTARMDDEQEYLSHGFAGCIRKPFTVETLLEGMEKVLTPGKEEAGRQPDFSLILQGEDKPDEMLGIFISESRKELSRLHAALERGDRKAVHDILHKNLPLWESLRLDYPLETLRRTATTDPALWTETDMERIREIEKAAGRLLRHAMNLQKKEE
jgi:signal transduction histidine kinase/DNA-binding response OmpR family regulator